MTRITARNRRTFGYGTWDRIRTGIHRGLELTSKNLFPNPKFDRIKADGTLEFWGELLVPPKKRGRNIYIGRRNGVVTKQNDEGLIPLRAHTYLQDEVLIRGEEMPGKHALDTVLRAAAAKAEARNDAVRGYPADPNCQIAFVWITGNPRKRSRRMLTTAGPFSDPFPLAEGQTYTVDLPQRRPHEAITGIGILQKPPNGSTADAQLQEVIDIRRSMPSTKRMRGPYRKWGKAPTSNQTFQGAENKYPPLNRRWGNSPEGHDFHAGDALVSWQFEMEGGGWSANQETFTLNVANMKKNTAMFVHPKKLPRGSSRWRMMIKLHGTWQTAGRHTSGQGDGGLSKRQHAVIHTLNPEKWPKGQPLISAEYSEEDLTGIEPPDEEPAAPVVGGVARLAPGKHVVYVTDEYDDGESRPSKVDKVDIASGENLLVRFRDPLRRRQGQVLPNADLAERMPENVNRPLFWTIELGPQVNAGDLGWEIRESRGTATTQQIYARLDDFDTDPTVPMCLRYYVDMKRHGSGSVGVRVRYLNANKNTIGTGFATSRSDDGWIETTMGPSGNGYDFDWPAGTQYIDVLIVGQSTGGAPIDLDADIISLGLFVGETAPRKRLEDDTVKGGTDADEGPLPKAEDHGLDYPESAYAVVIENYAGAGINAVEYYAPWDTVQQERLLFEDFDVPVRGGQTYTLQVEVEGDGLENGCELFRGVWVDDEGEIVGQTNGINLPVGVPGRINGVVSKTITAPPYAAEWRARANTLGRGRLVVSKPQLERGAAATVWTSDYHPVGQVTQGFDTWCPGAPITASNGIMSAIKELYDIVARADDPEGTSVSARIAFKEELTDSWGPWFSSPAELTMFNIKRYVKIEVTLNASPDLQLSPELYEYGVEVERETATLLRGDGSEFHGGAHVLKMPALNYPANEEARRNRDGEESIIELFEASTPELNDIEILAFSRRGVEQMNRETSRGNRIFEIQFRGVRYRCRILSFKWDSEGREDENGRAIWRADGANGTVIDTRPMR